ncbi:unnamed protein product [Protopolystoma xenopodis]|uniref:Uncharacterized protein n=1 Tax=Protopolystoma xenopodis TaxID=117903 RepID=A0A3S5CKS9_9PLAT|nr:unnamed protein product [Protopolystoma xenopodis]
MMIGVPSPTYGPLNLLNLPSSNVSTGLNHQILYHHASLPSPMLSSNPVSITGVYQGPQHSWYLPQINHSLLAAQHPMINYQLSSFISSHVNPHQPVSIRHQALTPYPPILPTQPSGAANAQSLFLAASPGSFTSANLGLNGLSSGSLPVSQVITSNSSSSNLDQERVNVPAASPRSGGTLLNSFISSNVSNAETNNSGSVNTDYYVMVHVETGETFSVRVGDQIQHIHGALKSLHFYELSFDPDIYSSCYFHLA